MTAPTAQSLPPTREQTINGERVLNLGATILVASKSAPGVWHEVHDGRCDCKSFEYRETCRHLETARIALEQDRASAEGQARYRCIDCLTLVYAPTVPDGWCRTQAVGGCWVCPTCARQRQEEGDTVYAVIPIPPTLTEGQAIRFLDARDERNLRWAQGQR